MKPSPLELHLILFLICMAVFAVFAPDGCRALMKLGLWVYCGAGFIITSRLFKGERSARLFIYALVLGGLVSSAAAILEFVYGIDLIKWDTRWGPRSAGTLYDPNFFGIYAGVAAILAAGVAAGSRSRVEASFAGLSAAVLGTGFLVSHSRSAFLATLIGLLVFCGAGVAHRSRRAAGLIGLGVLAPAVMAAAIAVSVNLTRREPGAYPLQTLNRLVSMKYFAGTEGRQRLLMWKTTGYMIRSHPLTGTGLGSYQSKYTEYQAPLLTDREFLELYTNSRNAYNDYLEMAAETGIPMLLLFLSFIIHFYITAFKKARGLSSRDFIIAASAAGGVAALLAHAALFQFPLSCPPLLFSLFSLMGLSAGLAPPDRGTGAAPERPPGEDRVRPALFRAAGLLLTALAVLAGLRPLAGSLYFRRDGLLSRVNTSPGAGDAFVRNAEKGLKFYPCDCEVPFILGTLRFHRGEYDAALRNLTAALDTSYEIPTVHLYLAAAHFKKGNFRESARHAALLKRLSPVSAFHEMAGNPAFALAFFYAGDFSAALEAFEAYLGKAPGNHTALYYAGLCHLRLHNNRQAAEYFSSAIRENDKIPDYYIALARALVLDGRREEADGVLESGAAALPDKRDFLEETIRGMTDAR